MFCCRIFSDLVQRLLRHPGQHQKDERKIRPAIRLDDSVKRAEMRLRLSPYFFKNDSNAGLSDGKYGEGLFTQSESRRVHYRAPEYGSYPGRSPLRCPEWDN